MVEQRSPKPSVACSSRVSPAKRSPLGLLFFGGFLRIEHATLKFNLKKNNSFLFRKVIIIALSCKRQANCVQYKYEKES